jgi:putative alpha-1,2-mannosidase
MNTITNFVNVAFIVLGLSFATANLRAQAKKIKDPVDYVDPTIGGLGHLLTATSPSVQPPYGMVRCVPITTGGADTYMNTTIVGFPAAGMTLMPTTGNLETNVAQYASEFDRDFETVTPYYGSNVLDKYDIAAEYTVARRAVFYRFSYPQKSQGHLLVTAGQGGEITLVGKNGVSGYSIVMGVKSYFYAVFSQPFSTSQSFTSAIIVGGRRGQGGAGGGVGLALDFKPQAGEKVAVRVGTSNISVEAARNNLMADIPGGNFDEAKQRARAVWNQELGKIAVTGGTERERTIFYTALYRSVGRPNDITGAPGSGP